VEHLRALLEGASTIELVDWPSQEVPATLLRAGYRVVGHEPDGFKSYVIVDDDPEGRVFPLAARTVAKAAGLTFVDGVDIAQAVRDLCVRSASA
jgi:hypothetical protein